MENNEAVELSNYVDSLDVVPEPVRSFYQEVEGGGYKIRVKNMVEKAHHDEFRENNRRLKAENDELRNKYSFVDIDEYKALKDAKKNEQNKGNVPVDELDKVIDTRTKEMRDNYLAQINDFKSKYETVEREYHGVLFKNAVTEAALRSGVRNEAITDVENRVRSNFNFKDGKLVAVDADGQTVLSKDGSGPKTVEEFISDLKATAPHFFPTSNGGAAPGNTRTNGAKSNEKMSAFDKIRAGFN